MAEVEKEPVLLDAASATGEWKKWMAGKGYVWAYGTVGGATLALEWREYGGTAVAVGTPASLTAAGMFNIDLPEGEIRMTVTGGSPSGLYAKTRRRA